MNMSRFLPQIRMTYKPTDLRQGVADYAVLAVNQVAAAILLLMLSPLLVVTALLIWRSDGAPILFAHYRVGRGGNLFPCLKFRTMRRDSAEVLEKLLREDPTARAEWVQDQKLASDPRITGIGEILRKTSLDELPQLFNVLRGEMSLVGPRPVTVGELDRYGVKRWHYMSVRPGITGLWQVSGRNNLSYEERVKLDQHYVEKRSLALDARILVKTVWVVLAKHGAR